MQPDTSVKKVLIYRLGSLGDTVIALPSLHLIERAFPQARRVLLSNVPVHAKAPAAAAVLDGSGLIHGYMHYTVGTRNPFVLLWLVLKIRRFRPDVLVYLAAPRGAGVAERDARFFSLCGIRRIVGLPVGDLAGNGHNPSTGLWEQEAARLLRCIEPLGQCDIHSLANWDLRLTGAENARADEVLAPLAGRPLIVCGPGTKMQAKDWGREKWRQLMAELSAAFPDRALALIGAKDDLAVSDYAAAGWKGPHVNLCGQLSPRGSAAVIRRAELFLGPDSGPMHLAAAYGVPCAIAFSAVDRPGRWFPVGKGHQAIYHNVECANCRLTVCVEKKKICIESISVEEMFQAALKAISSKEND